MKTRLTRTPTLVLDVRDWFATTFGIGPKPARPPGELAVTAEPVDPATPWPVRGALELVAVRTPAGMLGVFDRVRAPGGPLLRFRLAAGAYRLRVADPPKSYPMYQPFDVPNPVLVPEPGLPATVVPNVELLPPG